MSTQVEIHAQKREGKGKGVARKLRAAGRVPAVVYGQGGEATSLSIDARAAVKVFSTISVENTIIDLDVDGERVETLVREIQTHPFRNELVHVDFLAIKRGEKLDLTVPVTLVGTPEGVRTGGGMIEQIVHDLPIRCIPSRIPSVIEIDIKGLHVGDSILAGDLPLDEGVELLIEESATIVAVSAMRVAEEDEDEEGAEEEETEE